MPLSLEQVVRSPAYPDERQLVAILGQVSFRKIIQEHVLITAGRDWRSLPRSRGIRAQVSYLLDYSTEHGR